MNAGNQGTNAAGPAGSMAATLAHGRSLLEAQREALVAGDLPQLGQLAEALREWLALLARSPGTARIAASELAPLLGELEVNAGLAAGGAAQSGRARQAMLSGPGQSYDATGRATLAGRQAGSFSA